jgi:hypothetical protein
VTICLSLIVRLGSTGLVSGELGQIALPGSDRCLGSDEEATFSVSEYSALRAEIFKAWVFRSHGGWVAQERALTPPFIGSMSPPGYSSAWLRPRSARFRFTWQNHCKSATSCRFSTSGLPVTPPEPRPARPES